MTKETPMAHPDKVWKQVVLSLTDAYEKRLDESAHKWATIVGLSTTQPRSAFVRWMIDQSPVLLERLESAMPAISRDAPLVRD